MTVSIQSSKPLYSRAPNCDGDGRGLSDFMILIPGMRHWPGRTQCETIATMHLVLGGFTEVVFADLNLRLSLLWVSVKPRYGVIAEICTELQHVIPEAKLVASYSG